MMNYDSAWSSVEKTAFKMCHKYNIFGYEWEDLIQEARMELWETLKIYDETKGAKLNTLYYIRLRNRMTKILQKVSAKKNFYNLKQHSTLYDDDIEKFVPSNILDPETLIIRNETTKEWFEKFEHLHPHLKEILELRMKGLTLKEISDNTAFSFSTVVRRINLIKDFFKSEPSIEEIHAFNDELQSTLDRSKNDTKRSDD